MKQVNIPFTEKAMDECGVFGFYNNDGLDSIAITHDALFGLQHRGQISAGITVNENEVFSTVKELGVVSEVFTPKVLAKLKSGKITVGHVRYTSSQSLDRAANQPLVLRYREGSIAISANGAITNFPEIRKELEHGGAIFQSNSNAELMGYVIATERCATDNLEDAVLRAMGKLKGAYSAVICAPTRSPTRWNIFSVSAGSLSFVTPRSVIFQPFLRRCSTTTSLRGKPAKSAPTTRYLSFTVFMFFSLLLVFCKTGFSGL